MADVTKIDAEPVAADETVADGTPQCPFNGDSQRITWPRNLEIGQLQEEVTEALGPAVRLAAFFPLDDTGSPVEADAQAPVTLFVTPSSADLAAVRQVLAAHKPDPYYGLTDEERAQVQLRAKIASGQELTSDEMQMALRMLVAG